MGDLTYDSPEHPRNATVKYRCDGCGAEHVKLWRNAHGATDKHGRVLTCARCEAPNVVVDARGRSYSDIIGSRSSFLGNKVPAIPARDSFWGHTSSPSEAVRWWLCLPTYPGDIDPRDATIAALRAENAKLRACIDAVTAATDGRIGADAAVTLTRGALRDARAALDAKEVET